MYEAIITQSQSTATNQDSLQSQITLTPQKESSANEEIQDETKMK